MYEQLKNSNDSFVFRILLVTAFLLSLWVSNSAQAEMTVNEYIQSVPLVPVANSGAPTIPLGIATTIASGGVPPVLLYVYVNQVLSSAVKKAQEVKPNYRTPYVIAKEKFDTGQCIVHAAFKNEMILIDLPLIANRTSANADPNAKLIYETLLGLTQGFKDQAGCDSSNTGLSSIASGLLQFFGFAG